MSTQQPEVAPAQPRKKRRKWPWVLAAVAVVIVIAAVAGGGGGSSTSPAAGGEPAAAPEGITYEVSSDGGAGTALITYTTDASFNQAQENGAALPWTKTVDLDSNSFFTGASLVAQAGEGVESITCRITDGGGEVISENTSTGQYVVVTCSGT